MKISVGVSISRNSNNEITLSFSDNASHGRFLEVRMTPEQFAMAITGLGGIEVDAIVRGLDVVGKDKITERRSIECPFSEYSKEALVGWLIENGQEEGWIVDPYLGSQGSVTRNGGKTMLNYRVYRFAEVGHG